MNFTTALQNILWNTPSQCNARHNPLFKFIDIHKLAGPGRHAGVNWPKCLILLYSEFVSDLSSLWIEEKLTMDGEVECRLNIKWFTTLFKCFRKPFSHSLSKQLGSSSSSQGKVFFFHIFHCRKSVLGKTWQENGSSAAWAQVWKSLLSLGLFNPVAFLHSPQVILSTLAFLWRCVPF